jgi:hypothetical protein
VVGLGFVTLALALTLIERTDDDDADAGRNGCCAHYCGRTSIMEVSS